LLSHFYSIALVFFMGLLHQGLFVLVALLLTTCTL